MRELQQINPTPTNTPVAQDPVQATPSARTSRRKRHMGRTFVYLAVVKRGGGEFGGRFKIGVAIDPRLRLKGLPEGDRIDLRASAKRALPSPERALQVEKALHKALAPMRMSPGHQDDGYTEWFDLTGLATARVLLETLPDSEPKPNLKPVGSPKPLTNRYKRPWRLVTREDLDLRVCAANQRQVRRARHLWIRLAWTTPLQVHAEQGDRAARLVLPGFRSGVVPPGHSLRMRAMGSHGIYQLYLPRGVEGLPCSLVTRVDYAGEELQDLEIHLQPTKALERLPDGPAIVTTLRAALNTVAAMATAREEGWLAGRGVNPIAAAMGDFGVLVDELRVQA